MTDATTGGLTEQMYCSQQINVPLNLPYILKQYAKAAIRTQPSDLLYWSSVYFRALADGTTPPVKERLEYPPITSPSGLSPGFLKVLINQFGKGGVVPESEIEKRWLGVGLKPSALEDIFRLTGNEKSRVRWLNFVAVAAGFLCPSLTQTMILICELLTDDPDGGPATIHLDSFLPLYKYLSRLNCGPLPPRISPETSNIDEICGTRQHSTASDQLAADIKDFNELNEALDNFHAGKGYKSEEGLEVWQDIQPLPRKTDSRLSQEGKTSESGLAVFERVYEDAITPGYEDREIHDRKEQNIQKIPSGDKRRGSFSEHKNIKLSAELTKESRSKELSEIGEKEQKSEEVQKKISAEKGEKQSDQQGVETGEEKARDDDSIKTQESRESALKTKSSHGSMERKKVQEDLKSRLEEDKKTKKDEKAERKRLREGKRAEKKRLKQEEKTKALADKEQQEGGDKKEEGENEVCEDLDEEEIVDESSTESSSISIDPDLEVISSSQILREGEVWEDIEVEEESLDDEENKIIRIVKKRVKRKIIKPPRTEEEIEINLSEVRNKQLDDVEYELEMQRQQMGIESMEGFKGKPKEEVQVTGMLSLFPDDEDIVSVMSEPEQFETPFIYVPGIGPVVQERQIKSVIKYMTECSTRQGGYVMPRNIRHFLCPPIDVECKTIDSTESLLH